MITHYLPDGRKLVLAWHTPGEWAEIARSQMLRVGCSMEYAEAYAAQVRACTTMEPTSGPSPRSSGRR